MPEKLMVSRSQEFIGDVIGDDTIVINVNTGTYYSLGQPAGQLWLLTSADPVEVPTALLPAAYALLNEGLLLTASLRSTKEGTEQQGEFFKKYTDMADILKADPIHDVDEDGWPTLR